MVANVGRKAVHGPEQLGCPSRQTCTYLPVRLESQLQMRNVFRGHHVSLGLTL